MELTLKTELSIGQRLYYLTSKSKNVYAPCTFCNNERKVSALVADRTFVIDCPECSDKHIKGDVSNKIEIQQYELEDCILTAFVYGTNRYGKAAEKWRLRTSRHDDVDSETLIEDRSHSKVQLFTDRATAQAKLKELNKSENAKRAAFLKGLEVS